MAKEKQPALPELLTIQQAAVVFKTCDRTIRRRISDGSLLAYRVGPRAIRVDRDSLLALARPMAGAA